MRVLQTTSGLWESSSIGGEKQEAIYHSKVNFTLDSLNCKTEHDYYNLGLKQFEEGDYEASIHDLKRAIYRNALANDALYNCAIAFLKLEQDDSACFYLERIRHTAEAKVLIDSFCK